MLLQAAAEAAGLHFALDSAWSIAESTCSGRCPYVNVRRLFGGLMGERSYITAG